MEKVPQNGRTPQPVSAYDLDTDTYTYDVSQMDAQQVWRTAVALAATKARQSLPGCSTRVDRAIELVLNNAVELHADGSATITSPHNGTKTYTVCSGTCECADYPKAPGSWCKHKLAKALVIRAVQFAKELGSRTGLVTLAPETVQTPLDRGPGQALEPVQAAPEPSEPMIPPQYLVTQGKTFCLYNGLLALATSQGLLALTEEFSHVTDTYVLAQARAAFHDGQVFRGAADSTPDNVGQQVKPHWRRMALTRAKARALRDALNITLVAVEELN